MKQNGIPPNQEGPLWTGEQACKCGAEFAAAVTKCPKECLEAQLKKGHENMGIDLQEKIWTENERIVEDDVDLKAMQDLMNEFPLSFGG